MKEITEKNPYFQYTKESSNISRCDLIWLKWMSWGKRLGCHQKPERSFFCKRYQFPVCARCTGVCISSIVAYILFCFNFINWQWCFVLCMVMFIDWLIQKVKIKESTNIRRFITGLLGGYGFMTLQLYIYQKITLLIISLIIH